VIATTPDAIYDEIEDARKHAAKFHNFADERVRRYAAGRYRSDWLPTQGPVYKPHEWEYVTNMVPNLVYKNPGVEVEGLLEGVDDGQRLLLAGDIGAHGLAGGLVAAPDPQYVVTDLEHQAEGAPCPPESLRQQ